MKRRGWEVITLLAAIGETALALMQDTHVFQINLGLRRCSRISVEYTKIMYVVLVDSGLGSAC